MAQVARSKRATTHIFTICALTWFGHVTFMQLFIHAFVFVCMFLSECKINILDSVSELTINQTVTAWIFFLLSLPSRSLQK